MKILYIISVYGHGNGGHFHSLDHISRVISNRHQIKIISIGPGSSKIIKSSPFFEGHISFYGYNIIELRRNFNKLILRFKPDVLHFFDVACYNVWRVIFPLKKNKLVLSKCGGVNIHKFPFVRNLVLFSAENKNWFLSQKRFKKTNIALIPNLSLIHI